MDKYYIPKQLDVPFKMILWTLDEALLFLVPFVVAFTFFSSPLVGIGIGGFFVFMLKRAKGEEGHHFISHLIYWYLPPIVNYKVTPPSYVREIVG